MEALLASLRELCTTGSAPRIVDHLRGPREDPLREAWELLLSRARRCGEDPEVIADGALRFCREEPAMELAVVVIIALLCLECTKSMFNREVVECWFCGEERADRQAPYMNCQVFSRWAHVRLYYGVIGEDGMALF